MLWSDCFMITKKNLSTPSTENNEIYLGKLRVVLLTLLDRGSCPVLTITEVEGIHF